MMKRTRSDSIAQETIDEARMVLPGIQALFGFQLIAVFNERFRSLPQFEQTLHYAARMMVGARRIIGSQNKRRCQTSS